MTFTEAVRSVFCRYATFSGRASRSEFWWFFLLLAVATIVLDVIDALLSSTLRNAGVSLILLLAVLLPYLAVTVRRLHDSGRSGWWLLWLALAYLVSSAVLVTGTIGGLFSALSNRVDAQPETTSSTVAFIAVAVAGVFMLLGTVVAWIVQLTRASTPGPNRYGPHPLQAAHQASGPPAAPPAHSPWGVQQPPTYPG